MKEAIASFDAAGDALANDGASAAEGGDGGLAPRRVVRVDEGRRGAGLDGVSQFDERLEKPGVEGIDVIILAAHLHDSGLGRRRRRSPLSAPTLARTRRMPLSMMRSAVGVTWPPPAISVLMCRTSARAAAAVSVWSPKAASTR